jgi:ABC-type proline/glycine betaine transport system permease subunit
MVGVLIAVRSKFGNLGLLVAFLAEAGVVTGGMAVLLDSRPDLLEAAFGQHLWLVVTAILLVLLIAGGLAIALGGESER